jgi:valyl-tRNA synthetase
MRHPFIPFVTEAIWGELGGDNLIIAKWPEATNHNFTKSSQFDLVKEIIVAIRNARSENDIEAAKKLDVVIYSGSHDYLATQVDLLKSLRTGIANLTISTSGETPAEVISVVVAGLEIYLLGAIDKDKEKNRLEKDQENLLKQISGLETRLASPEFTAKAPAELVGQATNARTEYRVPINVLNAAIGDVLIM